MLNNESIPRVVEPPVLNPPSHNLVRDFQKEAPEKLPMIGWRKAYHHTLSGKGENYLQEHRGI